MSSRMEQRKLKRCKHLSSKLSKAHLQYYQLSTVKPEASHPASLLTQQLETILQENDLASQQLKSMVMVLSSLEPRSPTALALAGRIQALKQQNPHLPPAVMSIINAVQSSLVENNILSVQQMLNTLAPDSTQAVSLQEKLHTLLQVKRQLQQA